MTKKRKQSIEEQQRQSRKEVLRARRHERQTRQIWLAVAAIVGLLLIVVVIGLVNELALKPGQPVAVVNGAEISMREWQERVRLQRAQLIIGIENLAEALGQDIGQVQQFAGQQINLLMDDQSLGQIVLDEMIDDELIRQGADARGIEVSDADVQQRIEESFNYYGGALPTPTSTPTETPIPTPSLTPIPTAVITEVVPTETPFPTPTLGPTSTPLPTPTPLSEEAFRQDYEETITSFEDLGVSEEEFRQFVRAQLYRERLQEAIGEEEEASDQAEQVSFYYLAFDSKEEADQNLAEIETGDFLTVWNTVRSQADTPPESTATANELIWRTADNVESLLGSEVAQAAFELPVGEPSGVLLQVADTEEGADRYYIIQVSGREVRPLTERAIEVAKQQALQAWLDSQRATGVETFERWRANVPTQPALDPRFLVAPTPAPPTPTFPALTPEATP